MPLVPNRENGEDMGELIVLAALVGVGYWLYKSGKRIGSRKGFNVGLSRRRWRRR